MKLHKRLRAILLGLLMTTMLFSIVAFSADDFDLIKDINLTVSYRDAGIPLVGANFNIYLVATVDEYGEISATEPFEHINVNLQDKNSETRKTLAPTLAGYVLRDNIIPASSGTTDSNGLASFPAASEKLAPGLYLIMGQRHYQGDYRFDAFPFMVMLPAQDENTGELIYDLLADAKHDSKYVTDSLIFPDTVTKKVMIIWDDEGYELERPDEIAIQLLCNDEVFDTVILDAENNWRHTWTDLDDECTWTVVEKELDNYTVELKREGVTFVVTNTCSIEEIPEDLIPLGNTPDLGGTPDSILPETRQARWLLPFLLCAAMLLIAIDIIHRRRSSDKNK